MKAGIRVPENIPTHLKHDYEQKMPVTQICAWLVLITGFIYGFFCFVSHQVLSWKSQQQIEGAKQ